MLGFVRVRILDFKVLLCGIAHKSLVAGQEESRVNNVEDPNSQKLYHRCQRRFFRAPGRTYHQHAVQDVEQGLHFDDRSLPAFQQFH